MTTRKPAVSLLLSVILLPASANCLAQAATLSECQTIQDRLERYACYDRWDSASGAVRQATPPARAQPAAPSAEQAASAPAAPASPAAPSAADFGRPASSARVVENPDGDVELIDRVAALEERGPNLWAITLEGGQRWQQMLSKRYALEVGDEVRIYPTRWGNSYRLTSERLGGYVQVERIDAGAALAGGAPAPQTAPPAVVQDDDDQPSLLGRIFNRDGDEDEAAPAVETAGSTPASVENFGRTDARVVEREDGASELLDSVAALEQLGPNRWRITLEGGQRWEQMLSKRYALEVGDEVRIYPTRWGESFRLTAERLSGYIQVRRVD